MAQSYDLKPGDLPVTMTLDEPWSMSFTVSKLLTNYTHEAAVKLADETLIEMDVTATVGVSTTLISLKFSKANVNQAGLGLHRWYYKWNDPLTGERTILRGDVKVEDRS